jgi:hypothetical protein
MIALVGAWLSGFLSAFALGLYLERNTNERV